MKRMVMILPWLMVVVMAIYVRAQAYHLDEKEIRDDINEVDNIEKIHPELAVEIREYAKADMQLNFIYKKLMDLYEKAPRSEMEGKDKKDTEEMLKTAQMAWLKYRDLAVDSELSIHASRNEYYMSMARLTAQRVECLKSMLENMRDGFGGKGPYCFMKPAKLAFDQFEKIKKEK